MIELLATGPLATVQDLGRPGYAALGVPRSGAFDRGALRLANRLVGNPEDAAGVEITFGGLELRLLAPATLAFTGAACPGAPDWGAPITRPAGTRIRLGAPARGLRSYLAVRGGVDLAPVLGSRSTDILSGLGPPRLVAGDRLPIGVGGGGSVSGVAAAASPPAARLTVWPGPRADWFAPEAWSALTTAPWTVRAEADRVGVRLAGSSLPRAVTGELPSEPTRPGALQVPPDGPIVFGPDAPVTGGYPVLAIVDDLDAVAQLRPGDTVRFDALR